MTPSSVDGDEGAQRYRPLTDIHDEHDGNELHLAVEEEPTTFA